MSSVVDVQDSVFPVTLVMHVTMLTPFGFFRVSLFGEILLCGHGEYKFLTALNANQDFRLKTVVHLSPSQTTQITSMFQSAAFED
jgi:hypothetical protein